MPGPVSDSYDPEFGTAANCAEIKEALQEVYDILSNTVLKRKQPLFILDLVRKNDLKDFIPGTLTERDWRIIRFALERAKDSI